MGSGDGERGRPRSMFSKLPPVITCVISFNRPCRRAHRILSFGRPMAGAACRLACFSASGSMSLHLQRLRFEAGLLSSMAARPHLTRL